MNPEQQPAEEPPIPANVKRPAKSRPRKGSKERILGVLRRRRRSKRGLAAKNLSRRSDVNLFYTYEILNNLIAEGVVLREGTRRSYTYRLATTENA